jgi:molybdopterin molybdotransferase
MICVVEAGTALRILTGARLPEGADTIVAEEFVRLSNGFIAITTATPKGKNILAKGSDTAVGDTLIQTGQQLTPGRIGLLVAGGHDKVRVFRKPHVALIATGDEVLLPGRPLAQGKLYASNLLTLNSWCRSFGFKTEMRVVGDDADELQQKLTLSLNRHDAIVTSGGAWTGDKDLMARVLDQLGWEKKYHRVRLGPGKAAGFGLLEEKPVFILPGGPPSNLVAFLELALPGLLKLAGSKTPGLTKLPATLTQGVTGQSDWTQAIFGNLTMNKKEILFHPHLRPASRLKSMSDAQAIMLIPEGITQIDAGETIQVHVLAPPVNTCR